MNKDFTEVVDSYIDPIDAKPSHLELMSRSSKDPDGEQLDYSSLLNGDPNPSLRDHEYLQQSALWGHQYIAGGTGELEPYHLKPAHIKSDASLPAYCNPPNPCPVGVREDQGCQLSFENTASFSREYQSEQECMCDGEHMFACKGKDDSTARQRNSNYYNNRFQMPEHKKDTRSGWVRDRIFFQFCVTKMLIMLEKSCFEHVDNACNIH